MIPRSPASRSDFCASGARTPTSPVVFALALALLAVASTSAHASFTYSVGDAQTIYTAAQRRNLGLAAWPDGNMGVAAAGNGQIHFYGANSTTPTRTTGTLEDPGRSKQNVQIYGLPGGFGYVSGGPVYSDSASGRKLMIYHAEMHDGGSGQSYSSALGMAVSLDAGGLQFQDLGLIVAPNLPHEQRQFSIDVGGGSFAVLGDYLHVYFRDYLQGGGSSEFAVARAPLSTLLTNALNFQRTPFTKYFNNDWSEPALGGRSSPLEIGNPANVWSSVSYNDYLNGLVMVSSQWEAGAGDLYMSTSADGVNWTPRQAIALDPGEQMYPSLIGTGPDPTRTGRSFYAYYTDSAQGVWGRWNDASLKRRLITLDPIQQAEATWSSVANFKGDYQTGGPAAGWTYAWSAAGQLGNSASYAPLHWSESAGVYNTTGGATPVYDGKTHNDDYLMLHEEFGHPGRDNYAPVIGYTIQPEDGAGLYRLMGSSIMKGDNQVYAGEDGLDVSVYLNNTLLGSPASVSVNGTLTNFDRNLGQLAIGDTVYVAISSAGNQTYDLFRNFDFTIQHGVLISDPLPPPPPPPPPPGTPVWSSVASFKGDFKTGGPAAGWKYAWSAGGKLGDAATYAPLYWSASAGLYNTTGGATPTYDGKAHNDDYLMLDDDFGHPGRGDYAPVIGYTIQAEDGAGLYRLMASSITKGDDVALSGEDGLAVSVYLNNTLLGSPVTVSTTGAMANFNRNLGQLAVGDTVYVAIGAAGNQTYDLFRNFDFTIQRGVLSSDPPPVVLPPPPPPPPPPATPVWSSIANFRGDFQRGGPATGWKYVWSAGGKFGDAATYAPLHWSESAGLYNTTGAATPVYDGKAHNDDYLMLHENFGHPGRGAYAPIVGYTVQAEDGAGMYRLVASSIMKGDAVAQSGEDGLNVAVYRNNTPLGSITAVSTSGAVVGFDRDLGQLAVGDTIYVIIGAAKNQVYDLFRNFNFTIEKLIPATSQLMVQAVPEPTAAALCLAAVLTLAATRRRSSRRSRLCA